MTQVSKIAGFATTDTQNNTLSVIHNPEFVTADDSNNARGGGFSGSAYLDSMQFNFTIPEGSTINGIIVKMNKYLSTTGDLGGIVDMLVQLIVNGIRTGNNYADTTTTWSSNQNTIATYGNAADLWGTTLTPNDINNNNFGVSVRMKSTTGFTNRSGWIDYIEITVDYTDPTPTPTVTPSNTVTPTSTVTPSTTVTFTPTVTASNTVTPTSTSTVTPTITSSSTVTPTATISATPSLTPSITPTTTVTISASETPTPSPSPSTSLSQTPTFTPTNTPTVSETASVTPTPSQTPSPSITHTPSITPTNTVTSSSTPTSTITPTNTVTSSVTPTITPTPTITITPSSTPTYPEINIQVPTLASNYTAEDDDTLLILNPATNLLACGVTLPANPMFNHVIEIVTTKAITTFTVSANTGQTLIGGGLSLLFAAGTSLSFRYINSLSSWVRRF